MKILFLEYSHKSVSGGYRYNNLITLALKNQGHTVDKIPLHQNNFLDKLAYNFKKSGPNPLRQEKYDVILQDRLMHPSFFLYNRRQRLRPVVSVVHNLCLQETFRNPWHFISQSTEKKYLQTVDGFVATSFSTANLTQKLLKHEKPWTVIYPGRDTFKKTMTREKINERAKAKKKRILFIGSIIPQKGLDCLIEALSLIKELDWKLDVIGNPDIDPFFTGRLNRLIKQHALQERVILLGQLGLAQLQKKLEESHILAVPSWYEGFGMVYLEAMSFGLAVLAASKGGAGELIKHYENGFLVDPCEKEKIAIYLRMLLNRNELLTRIGDNAYRRHLEFPDWAGTADKLVDFLEQLTPPRA